jgi:hypothetical protein
MRRPWYSRARALAVSISELAKRVRPNRTRRPAATLGLVPLEERVLPSLTPLGEFQPHMGTDRLAPAVAADANGNFIVVSQGPETPAGQGIYGQMFRANGASHGPEFRINQDNQSTSYAPAVAMAPDGRFVVAWFQFDVNYGGVNNWEVFARRYNADGTPMGDEFIVNTEHDAWQYYPAVAVASDFSFLVAFMDNRGDPNTAIDISARCYDADGNARDAQFVVNIHTDSDQFYPSVGVDGDGNFVVGWTSQFQLGYWNGIEARRFANDGTSLSDEIQLNDGGRFEEMYLTGLGVAPDGSFVGTWAANVSPPEQFFPDRFDVFTRRFFGDGTPMTDVLPVNTYTAGYQGAASVAVVPDGGFTVVWMSDGQDGSGYGVFAQQFTSDGTKISPEKRLNQNAGGHQQLPRIAADGQGNLVTAWVTEGLDGSNPRVAAERVSTLGIGSGSPRGQIVVLPGQSWNDSVFQFGSWTYPTIQVTNDLSSSVAIYLSAQPGVATISAAAPGAQLNVRVDYGDAVWAGDFTGRLGLHSSAGSVSDLSISGDLDLSTNWGGTVGDVWAGNVLGVVAGDSIASVTAAGFINYVSGQNHVGQITAGGSVGAVDVQGDLVGVSAGGNIGLAWDTVFPPMYDVWDEPRGVHATSAITGEISAPAGDISYVDCSGDLYAPISAGGRIGSITCNGVLTSTITGHGIGFIRGDDGIAAHVESAADIDTITTWGNITGSYHAAGGIGNTPQGLGVQSLGGWINAFIWAEGDIGRGFPSLSDIGVVTYHGSIGGTITSGGKIGSVRAQWEDSGVTATIHAGTTIDVVAAGGTMSGSVTAVGDIYSVVAIEAITGWVQSTGGSIDYVAGGEISGDIHAGWDIRNVSAVYDGFGQRHDITGKITAGHDIVRVWASRDVTGNAQLTAGHDIMDVTAGANEWGMLTAGRNIIRVHAGSLGGYLHANVDIGLPPELIDDPNWDTYGLISDGLVTADISADQDVQSVSTRFGFVGSIFARRDIGTIESGGTIYGWITALRDIGTIQAGTPPPNGPPAIADVAPFVGFYAGRNIGTISATGVVRPPTITASTGSIQFVTGGQSINSTIHAAQSIGQIIAGSQTNPGEGTAAVVSGSIDAGGAIDLVAAFGGSLAAPATAGGNIGEVFATADITGTAFAHGRLQYVTARRNVTAAVTSDAGSIDLLAGGNVSGAVTARDDARLDVIGNLSGPVISRQGKITLEAGGNVTGSLTALADIDVTAHGDVSGTVRAGDGTHTADAMVSAWGTISGPITASGSALIDADGDVTANVTAAEVEVIASGYVSATLTAQSDTAYVSADGGVYGTIRGVDEVNVWAGASISATVTSTEGDVTLQAGEAVSGTISAHTGAYVEAGSGVYGSLTVGDATTVAGAGVYAGGTMSASVSASGDVDIEAGANVTGSLSSQSGDIQVTTTGDLVSGSVTAFSGAVTIQAHDIGQPDNAEPVRARGTIVISATGSVYGSVTSETDAVDLHADGSISAWVHGQKDVLVQAEGHFAGGINAGDDTNTAHAWVFAGGSLDASIFAYGPVVVQVDGDLAGSIEAASGNVTALAWGLVYASVQALDGDAFVWGGDDVPGSVDAEDDVELITFGHLTGTADGEAGEEAVWELDGQTGEDDLENQFGFSSTLVQAIRDWYDQLPTIDRGDLNDRMAAALGAVPSALQVLGTLRDAYCENVLLGYMKQRSDGGEQGAIPAAEWNDLQDWYRGLKPEDKEPWVATLRNGLGQDGLSSAENTVKFFWDAAKAKATQFAQNKAQWDQQYAQESGERQQRAQILLAAADRERQLERQAALAWNSEWQTLSRHRRIGLLGSIEPESPRQAQLGDWIDLIYQKRFQSDFEVVQRDTPQGTVYDANPLTDAGRQMVKDWEEAKRIAGLRPDQKLFEVLELMTTDAQLKQQLIDGLSEEIVTRLKGLLAPSNVAMMIGIGGTLSWVGTTAAAPVVIPLVGAIGYALFGKEIFDISKEFYLGIATALDARTFADYRTAATRLNQGIIKAAGTGTDALGQTMGAGAVRKLGNRLRSIRKSPEATVEGKVKTDVGGTETAKLKENTSAIEAPTKPNVPSVRNGAFGTWFDELPQLTLEQMWQDPILRNAIKLRLRSPGGFHEWLPVSRAPTFKKWGVTAEQIYELSTTAQ